MTVMFISRDYFKSDECRFQAFLAIDHSKGKHGKISNCLIIEIKILEIINNMWLEIYRTFQ